MKAPFFLVVALNISLHLFHLSSRVNPAYRPSRRLSQPHIDSTLRPKRRCWYMDSNVMKDLDEM